MSFLQVEKGRILLTLRPTKEKGDTDEEAKDGENSIVFSSTDFCVYFVPTEVLAAEFGSFAAAGSIGARLDPEESVESFEEPKIISEIMSSRDEYQKEYLLDNGQRMLSVYPMAVHYKDEDGQWQEIDNTLRTTFAGGKREYRNTAGTWVVSLPASLSGSNGISIARNDNVLRFRFAGQLVQDDLLRARYAQTPDCNGGDRCRRNVAI